MQPSDGTLHRQHGRMKNVQLVDFVGFRAAQTPAQRFLFDLFIERQTAFFAQLFGIIQPGNRARRVKDHRSGDDRAN
ncbi:Uncharacterised protein [Shigella flexneri]|nr:Uncharacterised protein [Shigella sonnei]SRN30304.1 Uncharacterised protein [Shigella flexneri]